MEIKISKEKPKEIYIIRSHADIKDIILLTKDYDISHKITIKQALEMLEILQIFFSKSENYHKNCFIYFA